MNQPKQTLSDDKQNIKMALLMEADIFELLGLSNLSEDEKLEKLEQMQEIVWMQFIELDVLPILTPEEIKEFEKIADISDYPTMFAFITERIPEMNQIVYERALAFKKQIVAEHMAIRAQISAKKFEEFSKRAFASLPPDERESFLKELELMDKERNLLSRLDAHTHHDDWQKVGEILAELHSLKPIADADDSQAE